MVTDYFFVYSYFSSVRKKNEKNFWDMEIIGNRQKRYILREKWESNIKKENYCLQKRQFPCIEIYSYLQIGAYSKIHIFMGFECIKNTCYHSVVILLYPCNFLLQKSFLPRIGICFFFKTSCRVIQIRLKVHCTKKSIYIP